MKWQKKREPAKYMIGFEKNRFQKRCGKPEENPRELNGQRKWQDKTKERKQQDG